MPAQRAKPSLGPHSLELLYSKYGPDKLHTSVSSSSNPTITATTTITSSRTTTTTTTNNTASKSTPRPSQLTHNPVKPRHRRPPPPTLGGQELGDLTKLGGGLSKLERVHLLLDMSHTDRRGQAKTGSQSGSDAGMNSASLPGAVCSQCSQAHKPTERQSKLKDLKSKLRLVAPRSLPDKASPPSGSSSARQSSQNVVPLPLLHIRFQRQDSPARDFSAAQEGRQALRGMLFPQYYKSSVAVWNFRTPGGSLPTRSQDFLDSTNASTRFLTSAGVPPSSGLGRGCHDADTISTFDADRLDCEQFEYVFDRFSALSTESDHCTTVTPESDTATFSARAQRPSTTDSIVTYQHPPQRRSSRSRPLTPIRYSSLRSQGSSCLTPTTPHHHHRAHTSRESWPPRFTVIPSWPALDDPFRFQYLGQGVHRDIVRRLHRSRGGRKRGSLTHQEDIEAQPSQPQQSPVPQLPQKLDIVMPTHTECHLCKTTECEHTATPRQGPTTARSTRPPSLSALSVQSRVSECRSRPQSLKPVPGPVIADSDTSWCIQKTCHGRGNDMLDRGHYTAHNMVN